MAQDLPDTPDNVTNQWDVGFDARGLHSTEAAFHELRARALAHSPGLANLLPTAHAALPTAFSSEGRPLIARGERRLPGHRPDPGTEPSLPPPPATYQHGDIIFLDLS